MGEQKVRETNDKHKAWNQLIIECFMRSARQPIPVVPTAPDLETRKLRARLILEEALELINSGLGLIVFMDDHDKRISMDALTFIEDGPVDLVELADGCADLEVINTGTASACGIALQPIFEMVMGNNMLKFAPGHTIRADGKLVKPKDHPAIQDDIYGNLKIVQGMVVIEKYEQRF